MEKNLAPTARRQQEGKRPHPVCALSLDRADVTMLRALLRPWVRRHRRAAVIVQRLTRGAA